MAGSTLLNKQAHSGRAHSSRTAAEQDAEGEQATRSQRRENQAKAKKEYVIWTKQRYDTENYAEIVTGTKIKAAPAAAMTMAMAMAMAGPCFRRASW
ncbi:hypothetical protein A4X09_0g2507 [Tilletia walkeri]|uniref:Uncharacterized protein n=1 Tax=Tilletia walkeri TaxID=117179 RepID=A0A8X7T609_9BASI|nr:hypothetical protein A4X09_0g2507 [Tilletia walkeri]